jgi:hypothetical protein
MTARILDGNVIAVECKRYGQDSELDERALLGEMAQAAHSIADLDLWVLVASRAIGSRLFEELNKQAASIGIGFCALSDADGQPGSLEVLCASSPSAFLDHPAIRSRPDKDTFKNILAGFTQKPSYSSRLSELRDYFLSPLVGYHNWRIEQNKGLLKSLASAQDARASYGQPINVAEPGVHVVPRTSLSTSISEWYEGWTESHSILSVLGEEGDGKTWGVAAWLTSIVKKDDDSPAVVLVPSSEIGADVSDPDVGGLLVAQIVRKLRLQSREHAVRRLERWVTAPAPAAPLMILVLDGVNERGTRDSWRRLFQQVAGDIWTKHVAVITTCRTAYWERNFKPLTYLPVKPIVMEPFDDTELSIALSYHNLSPDCLESGLLPMIRKPRYFDQMVRLREKMATGGEVTPARLLFEDWRDRYERKGNLTLNIEEFQNVIRGLAEQHQAAHFAFTEHEVTEVFPESDRRAVLEELRTGGVLNFEAGKYHVNKSALVHGLALLLVDQLREAVKINNDPREVIATWMEPHSEMDLKAEISEFAILYVLGSDILPTDYEVALLESWIASNNPGLDAAAHLIAYLPRDPEAYVSLAESVWSDAYNNRWAQQNLIQGFIAAYNYLNVSMVLRKAFERWLGFVHQKGSPIQRYKPEDADRLRREMAERIGHEAELGRLTLGTFVVTVINDDGLVRLSKVAIAVISHLDRSQFCRALACGCLADVVMGYRFNHDLISWVVRTSQNDLRESLQREIEQLLALNSEIGRTAAIRLLSFEGSEWASELITSIPQQKVRSEVMARHADDPCTSFVQWKREECLKCLERPDINPNWAAQQIKSYVLDPAFAVPESFTQRLINGLRELNKDQVWIVLGTTSADHHIDIVEPILAAHAPIGFSEFIRSLDRQIVTRNGMARRQLCIALINHYLLLQPTERKGVHEAWESLIANAAGWSKEDEEAELFLMEILLPQLTAEEQLSALLRRPETARDLIRYENNFRPLTDFNGVRTQLESETNFEILHRILWFLTEHPAVVPVDLFDNGIVTLIDNEDSIIRSKVLELTYLIKSPRAIDRVVNGTWSWDVSIETFENHWGSLVLCEHGDGLAFEEISRRIDPNYLGYALTRRGNVTDEVMQYAEIIHQVWLRLTRSGADLPLELPQFVIESSVHGRTDHVPRWDLSKPLDPSITFASRYLSWGGIEPASDLDLSDWNSDASVRKYQNLQERVREVIVQQKASGNVWFGRDFRGAGLDEVISIRPDLADEWLAGANPHTMEGLERIRRGGAFYDALCTAFLKQDSEKGVTLYWQLANTPGRTTVIDSDTEIDLLDYALFDNAKDEFITAAWQRKLDGCQSDLELMKVVLLLERAKATDWLWSYLENRIDGAAPLDRARARVLLGFMDDDKAQMTLEGLNREDPNTWMKGLSGRALDQLNRRKWAKEWFVRFLTKSSDQWAWGAFRLLLKCVDTSFWFWWEKLKDDVKPSVDLPPNRLVFMEDNSDNLQNAISKNEEDLAKRLLGQKIMKRQLWPWM